MASGHARHFILRSCANSRTPPFCTGWTLRCVSQILFGGMSQKQDVHEIYELKLTVRPMRWVCIHTHGTFRGPRISATAFLSPFDLSSIYVFGGTINIISTMQMRMTFYFMIMALIGGKSSV